MATSILQLADLAWRGEIAIEEVHPLVDPIRAPGSVEEVAPGVAFLSTFANITAFRTADGLVLVDTGIFALASTHHERIRSWDGAPLHSAVFSHGHVDHVFGLGPFDAEAMADGQARPRVVAHDGVPARFSRYVAT